MLRPLLATWYSCTQQLGDTELSIRLLVEMLGHGEYGISITFPEIECTAPLPGLSDGEDPGSLERSLLTVLKVISHVLVLFVLFLELSGPSGHGSPEYR
jgi:hypothetical protein